MSLQIVGNPTIARRDAGGMKREPAYYDALRDLLRQPMTPAETAHFRSQVAAQMADDLRRREPTPQLPLEAAA